MKKKKMKLSLNKITVTSLTEMANAKGGTILTSILLPQTLYTCYQEETCYWTNPGDGGGC